MIKKKDIIDDQILFFYVKFLTGILLLQSESTTKLEHLYVKMM